MGLWPTSPPQRAARSCTACCSPARLVVCTCCLPMPGRPASGWRPRCGSCPNADRYAEGNHFCPPLTSPRRPVAAHAPNNRTRGHRADHPNDKVPITGFHRFAQPRPHSGLADRHACPARGGSSPAVATTTGSSPPSWRLPGHTRLVAWAAEAGHTVVATDARPDGLVRGRPRQPRCRPSIQRRLDAGDFAARVDRMSRMARSRSRSLVRMREVVAGGQRVEVLVTKYPLLIRERGFGQ